MLSLARHRQVPAPAAVHLPPPPHCTRRATALLGFAQKLGGNRQWRPGSYSSQYAHVFTGGHQDDGTLVTADAGSRLLYRGRGVTRCLSHCSRRRVSTGVCVTVLYSLGYLIPLTDRARGEGGGFRTFQMSFCSLSALTVLMTQDVKMSKSSSPCPAVK